MAKTKIKGARSSGNYTITGSRQNIPQKLLDFINENKFYSIIGGDSRTIENTSLGLFIIPSGLSRYSEKQETLYVTQEDYDSFMSGRNENPLKNLVAQAEFISRNRGNTKDNYRALQRGMIAAIMTGDNEYSSSISFPNKNEYEDGKQSTIFSFNSTQQNGLQLIESISKQLNYLLNGNQVITLEQAMNNDWVSLLKNPDNLQKFGKFLDGTSTRLLNKIAKDTNTLLNMQQNRKPAEEQLEKFRSIEKDICELIRRRSKKVDNVHEAQELLNTIQQMAEYAPLEYKRIDRGCPQLASPASPLQNIYNETRDSMAIKKGIGSKKQPNKDLLINNFENPKRKNSLSPQKQNEIVVNLLTDLKIKYPKIDLSQYSVVVLKSKNQTDRIFYLLPNTPKVKDGYELR